MKNIFIIILGLMCVLSLVYAFIQKTAAEKAEVMAIANAERAQKMEIMKLQSEIRAQSLSLELEKCLAKQN